MRRIVQSFSKTKISLSSQFALIALVGVAVLTALAASHRGFDSFVMAAKPGLDGPEIQLLEKQNQAFERIVQATTPAIVYIRTEHVVKLADSPLFMDPAFRQFFRDNFGQIPQEQRQHALGTGVIFDPAGYIVTNNHVIDHANTVEVMLTNK